MALATAPQRARLSFLLLAATVLLGLLPAFAARAQQSPIGLWETISDVDGRPKGHIRIREVQGELRGTVEEIVDPKKRDDVCDQCSDERHNLRVLGLTILTGMRPDGDGYAGGSILDPDNGKVYSCKLAVVDGGKHLAVRGFIGFSLLGRTQTWNRLE
jgi:uncharacterized protein (DUF2147 family)